MPPRKRSKACFPGPRTTHVIEVKLAISPGNDGIDPPPSPARLLQQMLDHATSFESTYYRTPLYSINAAISVAGQPPLYSRNARDSVYNPDRSDVDLHCTYLEPETSHFDPLSAKTHCNVFVSLSPSKAKIFWDRCTKAPIAELSKHPFESRHPLGSFKFRTVLLPCTSFLQVNKVYATQGRRRMPRWQNAWISSSNMTIFLLCVQRLKSLPKLPDDVVQMVLEPAVYHYQGPYEGTQVTVEFTPHRSEFCTWTVKKLVKHLSFWNRLWSVSDDLQALRKPELIERAEAAMTRGPIKRVLEVRLTNLECAPNIPYGHMQCLDHRPCGLAA